MFRSLLKGTSLVSSLLFMGYVNAGSQDVGKLADNAAGGGNSILELLVIGCALVGLFYAITGLLGLLKGRNGGGQDQASDNWKKLLGGAIAFSIFGLITAFNMQVFQDTADYQNTRSLIQTTE